MAEAVKVVFGILALASVLTLFYYILIGEFSEIVFIIGFLAVFLFLYFVS